MKLHLNGSWDCQPSGEVTVFPAASPCQQPPNRAQASEMDELLVESALEILQQSDTWHMDFVDLYVVCLF